jgi:two-component system response regulator AtoC
MPREDGHMRREERPNVLVVDEDPVTRQLLSELLSKRGVQATLSEDLGDALRTFHGHRPAAVILDIEMPGRAFTDGGRLDSTGSPLSSCGGFLDGLTILPAMKRIDRDVPIIATSSLGRTPTIVRAIKLGASDFIRKPFTELELDTPLNNALRQRHLASEIARLREELRLQTDRHFLFECTPRMAEVAEQIRRIAETDATVLLRGASGTGKELAARAVHAGSERRDRPLVKVNCAALPPELLEAELFGYERGAFAAATQPKPGKFEFANRGTLFLDEVGGLGVALQERLLQVLEQREFRRGSDTPTVRLDVRVVASTKHDLERAVAEGRFRMDLLQRLSTVTIRLPELRDRREEIPILTQYFLKKYSVQYNKPFVAIASDTMRLLMAHDWPGNVRELEHVIKRHVVFGNDAEIRKAIRTTPLGSPRPPAAPLTSPPAPEAAPETGGHPVEVAASADAAVDGPDVSFGTHSLKAIARAAAREAERTVIARMLLRTRWNRKEAAESLGISYKALLYKIRENGLDKAI